VKSVLVVQNCPRCPLLSMTLIGSYYEGMCPLPHGVLIHYLGWADLSLVSAEGWSPKDS